MIEYGPDSDVCLHRAAGGLVVTRMREYNIDLQTLLPLLIELRQSGFLSAWLTLTIEGQRERCMAHIHLVDGRVVICRVVRENGQICASGGAALTLLYTLGTHRWYLEVPPSARAGQRIDNSGRLVKSGTRRAALSTNRIPWRVPMIDADLLQRLPRRQRRILLLVDGVRSVAQIATLIGLRDVNDVFVGLHDLATLGLVGW